MESVPNIRKSGQNITKSEQGTMELVQNIKGCAVYFSKLPSAQQVNALKICAHTITQWGITFQTHTLSETAHTIT